MQSPDVHAEPSRGNQPGALWEQSTVANDTAGVKTWTLTAPFTPNGLFWVVACPQGTGSPGETWLSDYALRVGPSSGNAAAWDGQVTSAHGYFTTSGAYASNPTITYGNEGRQPFLAVRLA